MHALWMSVECAKDTLKGWTYYRQLTKAQINKKTCFFPTQFQPNYYLYKNLIQIFLSKVIEIFIIKIQQM